MSQSGFKKRISLDRGGCCWLITAPIFKTNFCFTVQIKIAIIIAIKIAIKIGNRIANIKADFLLICKYALCSNISTKAFVTNRIHNIVFPGSERALPSCKKGS